jgi:uncharacterized protein
VPARLVGNMSRAFARLAAFLLACLLLAAAAPIASPPVSNRTIVVFGDSQAQGVAVALKRLFMHDRATRILDMTVPGTALSQALQHDWVGSIQQFLDQDHADIAVLMFGGNDRLAVRLEAGGRAIPYKTEAWTEMYRHRLGDVLTSLGTAKVPVVWLGQPVARAADYSADMAYLNDMFQQTVQQAGGDFLPLWTVIADDDGNYTAYGKALDGETKRLRLDDGIHFTPAGYDIIAAKVKDEIDSVLAKEASTPPEPPPAPSPAVATAEHS